MRGVPAWALKAGAVGLTILATYGAAAYVGGHVKNGGAPLRPSLHPVTGQVTLGPAVRGTTSQPVTETYAS
ncbi:MAG TPA: hypothetical protein VOB72_00085 [Candidatus Dormibacteraeota bacterium]|nr:hypothetical protein [Candidatus Dormibacteraeota bacterium]